MELEALLTTILVPASLLCAAWMCLPDILLLLGRVRIQRGILGGPETIPQHTEIAPEELIRQVIELGFDPAGAYWETMPGHKMFHELIFVADKGDCFGIVSRLFENAPPHVSFFSVLSGDAIILTQNYPSGVVVDEETLRAGPPGPAGEPGQRPQDQDVTVRYPLADVLAEHRHRIAHFALTGRAPVRAATIEDFVEGQRLYTQQPAIVNLLRGASFVLLPIKLVFLSLLPLIVAADIGVAHPATWAALALSCLGLIAFRHYGFPLIAGVSKAAPPVDAEAKS